jgi:hypothetical protein
MSTMFVDFAICPCGEQTAIQPSTPVIPNVRPQPSETIGGSIFVACPKCKRIYRFDTAYLVSVPTTKGLAPYNPDSPIRVFQVPIECDGLNCGTLATVFVTLSATTTHVELEKEKATWIFP